MLPEVDHYEYVSAEMVAEMAKEERWKAFREFLTAERRHAMLTHRGNGWNIVAGNLTTALSVDTNGYDPIDRERAIDTFRTYLDFAETEGWSGAFACLASAMKDAEQERERLLTQG